MSLWMVRGGRHGEQESVAFEHGLACIGFSKVPDLTEADSREAVSKILRQVFPDAPGGRISNHMGQLYAFAHRMNEGDLIAMPLRGRPKVALGRVTGSYQYRTDLGPIHHARKVEWIQADVPRVKFGQDLLYAFGAFMTVCQIQKNNAEDRVQAILDGKADPGALPPRPTSEGNGEGNGEIEPTPDVEQLARDQIMAHLEKNFKAHELARLVDAVLQAEGYVTELSPPGPDGGVDILAGQGTLGFQGPRLCVQVKSSDSPTDVTVLRALQGSMTTFKADQGVLVCWGGFKNTVEKEARMSFFSVRLWDADNLVEAVLRNYDRLPEEIRSELPLKRIWALVLEE